MLYVVSDLMKNSCKATPTERRFSLWKSELTLLPTPAVAILFLLTRVNWLTNKTKQFSQRLKTLPRRQAHRHKKYNQFETHRAWKFFHCCLRCWRFFITIPYADKSKTNLLRPWAYAVGLKLRARPHLHYQKLSHHEDVLTCFRLVVDTAFFFRFAQKIFCYRFGSSFLFKSFIFPKFRKLQLPNDSKKPPTLSPGTPPKLL